MRIIAHRGLIDGPDVHIENTDAQFKEALKAGFDIEVDIRYSWDYSRNDYEIVEQFLSDGFGAVPNKTKRYYFKVGHDNCTFIAPLDYFNDLAKQYPKQMIWLHCKNVDTLHFALKQSHPANIISFFHETDAITLTEKGYVWTHPTTKEMDEKSIWVLPEQKMTPSEFKFHFTKKKSIFAVCTDFPRLMKKAIE